MRLYGVRDKERTCFFSFLKPTEQYSLLPPLGSTAVCSAATCGYVGVPGQSCPHFPCKHGYQKNHPEQAQGEDGREEGEEQPGFCL